MVRVSHDRKLGEMAEKRRPRAEGEPRRQASKPRRKGPPPRPRAGRKTRPSATRRPGTDDDASANADHHPRLQKFLASAGVDSRRNCEEYIRQGRVTVDGRVVTNPAEIVDPDASDIRLDGERLRRPELRYYLINKPPGVLCTNRDPQGRPRAIDLVPARGQRLFTVGRLDESTEGLLLVTNDGELAQKLAHPKYQVLRRYRAQVVGIPGLETLQQLKEGIHFSDGFFRFRTIRILRRRGQSALLELELKEGKNREIRRLLAKVGHKVTSLQRVSFGPLRLGILHPGRYRELSQREVDELRAFVSEGSHESPGTFGVRQRRPPNRKGAAGRRNRSRTAGTAPEIPPGASPGKSPAKTPGGPPPARKFPGANRRRRKP